jgi:hypothetical protein
MRFRGFARALATACAVLVLAACQSSLSMDGQTIAYNKAVADSTNQFFLLNALRARDRFPIYYSRTTGENAATGISPGVTLGLSGWDLTPVASVGGSVQNQLSLANLDDQKFMRGVLTPVPLSTLEFYFGQGWPKEVLLMMFIKKITIGKDLVHSMAEQFDTLCADSNQKADYCADARPSVDGAIAQSPSAKMLSSECLAASGKDVVFDNYPSGHDTLPCFQAMLRVLIALGLTPEEATRYSVIVPNLSEAKAGSLEGVSAAVAAKLAISRRKATNPPVYALCSKSEVSGFTLSDEFLHGSLKSAATSAFRLSGSNGGLRVDSGAGGGSQVTTSIIASAPRSCAEQAQRDEDSAKIEAGCKAKSASPECQDAPTLSFATRSLDGMIFYLGEDLRAEDNVSVWISNPDGPAHVAPLFVASADGGPALVTTEFRGQTYIIPDDCNGQPHCEQGNRSLQVLSLLSQIWGLQKEASDAPSVPVVSVINDH